MKLILIILFLSPAIFAMPASIILMRHGEKPDQGNELSERGWQRAKALPTLFDRIGSPVALYGMSPKNDDGSIRAIQTLKYVAEKFKLVIQSDFNKKETVQLISDIKKNKIYDGKIVVICWEHKYIIEIAQLLGVTQNINWPGKQFDRYWRLDYSPQGVLTHYQDLPERLLPGDSSI